MRNEKLDIWPNQSSRRRGCGRTRKWQQRETSQALRGLGMGTLQSNAHTFAIIVVKLRFIRTLVRYLTSIKLELDEMGFFRSQVNDLVFFFFNNHNIDLCKTSQV